MYTLFSDEFFMNEALKQAIIAFENDEVPVGAVVVCNDRIIARAHNLTERLNDVTAHAEMQAITAASNFLGAKYLNECALYVTMEPCCMCAGASYWSRLGKIVYAAKDEKRGFSKISGSILHPSTEYYGNILETESVHLLKQFFLLKRDNNFPKN